MNRRTFIKTVTAAAIAASPARLEAQAPTRRRIKVGFLGCAHSHFGGKYKILRNSAEWDLIGVCEENAAARAQGPADARWLSAEQLFAEAEVVVIESAVKEHGRDALRALAAGRHIHVEKPAADNLEDVRRMVALAREKKRLLQVGYQWRYHPGLNAMLEAARQGWLGEIYQVRATIHTQAAPEQRADWGQFHGGSLFELGGHLIDPMLRLLGKPKGVVSKLRQRGPAADTLKDNNVAVFEFERALGIVTNSTWQPNAHAHRSFEVLGDRSTAVLRPIEPPTLVLDLTRAAGPYKAGSQTVQLPDYQRYVGDFVELAAAVRGEKLLSVTLDEELLVQEWLLRACEMM